MLVMLLIALSLAGCTGGVSDPHALIAAGEAALQATDAAIYALGEEARGTAAAIAAEERQSALEARRTEQAMTLQQTESAGQVTATVGASWAIEARATAQAVELQATQSAYLHMLSAKATEARIETLRQEETSRSEQNRQWHQFWYNFVSVLAIGISLFGVAPAMVRLLWKLSAYAVEWADRKRRMLDTASGPFVLYQLPDGNDMWMPATDAWHMRPRPGYAVGLPTIPQADRLEPAGETIDEPNIDDTQVLAGRLVLDAIGIEGQQGVIIPSWRSLRNNGRQWSSRPWQRAVQWLSERGAVDVVEKDGTYLAEPYPTLYSLNVALVANQLSPTPRK